MPKFAIVRQDGEVDVADGSSIADVGARYGWPGNGEIREYAGEPVRHSFDSPADQSAIWADAQAAEDARVASDARDKLADAVAAHLAENPPTIDTSSPEFKAAVSAVVADHLAASKPVGDSPNSFTGGTGGTGGSV